MPFPLIKKIRRACLIAEALTKGILTRVYSPGIKNSNA
jgi:hypothetical protein